MNQFEEKLIHQSRLESPTPDTDLFPAALRGRQSKRMTLNIDIAPTVLELANVPVPASMQGDPVCNLKS